MLTNSEMQIAPRITPRLKIPGFGESHPRLRRRRKIGRSTEQPWQVWRDSVQNFRGSVAPSKSLRIGRKNRNVVRPILRQLPFLNLSKLRGQLREFLGVIR